VHFRIIGNVNAIDTIAIGRAIRELRRLVRTYGQGRWRKRKGIATVQTRSGAIRLAELHWYEAHGIGTRELKNKRYLDPDAPGHLRR
jgi:hypothetical protein